MDGTVHVLDDYYLAITLLITIAYQLFFFSIAFTFKFDKLTGKKDQTLTLKKKKWQSNTRQK